MSKNTSKNTRKNSRANSPKIVDFDFEKFLDSSNQKINQLHALFHLKI